ncbi:MDR/zinc-dependent alcohol dehydrogenase-like family protein [Humisphaera borealis]|uniref:Alcohol dehydrogenase catalytic domain-containing protein n=1 Tax=Humisphaera borealis TaxID=2807512 RepID=A0A7M2X0E8_9BACT|nr:alcohol dehydrogenase catalytic domain-containing protein [Humisphaera borealis]QOV90561.1 alcohol dehydrogenase catalytic domain-containing protein [Humisphaera borealis]
MRALVFDSRLSFQPRQSEPLHSLGDSLIRVRQAGICSTDLEITRGYMGYKGILGHEFVGDVVDSADRQLIGKRVVGEINVVCGRCDLCLSGLSTHCRNRSVLGILNHDGAFADYVRLPSANLHVLPDTVDDDQAVFVEPLAAAYQVVKQIKLDSNKWVTVLGDGRLGLLVAQALRETGAPVRVIGKHPDKLALCEKWSIRSRPLADIVPRHDQDVVVDCTGSAGGFELAMQMVRPRGTIVLKSTVAQGKPLNLAPLVIDEVNVVGSRCGPFREAIRALGEKRIDVASLIHRRMKLDQGVAAMELAGRPGVLKVLLSMD